MLQLVAHDSSKRAERRRCWRWSTRRTPRWSRGAPRGPGLARGACWRRRSGCSGAWAARPAVPHAAPLDATRATTASAELAEPLLLTLPGGARLGVCGDRFAPGGGRRGGVASGRAAGGADPRGGGADDRRRRDALRQLVVRDQDHECEGFGAAKVCVQVVAVAELPDPLRPLPARRLLEQPRRQGARRDGPRRRGRRRARCRSGSTPSA